MTVIKGSTRLETAGLLTLCGGYLDAYTYFVRGGVFANAQTGNIIKLGIQMVNGSFETCLRYLIPICAFIIGVIIAMSIRIWMEKHDMHIIRRTVLVIEMAALIAVSLIPAEEDYNLIANTLVSFACAMQMEAFTSFVNQPIATTVSTGNLRKCVEYLIRGTVSHKKEDFKTAGIYFLILMLFIGGVVLGTLISDYLGVRSILAAVFLLALAFVVITLKTKIITDETAA